MQITEGASLMYNIKLDTPSIDFLHKKNVKNKLRHRCNIRSSDKKFWPIESYNLVFGLSDKKTKVIMAPKQQMT